MKKLNFKTPKKPFTGYESTIFSLAFIGFSLVGLSGKFKLQTWVKNYVGIWHWLIFIAIGYVGIMQLIRRKFHSFLVQNAAGFVLLLFSLAILTTNDSGKMGVFFAKWLVSVMHPVLWGFISVLLFLVAMSLFIFSSPFRLFVNVYNFISKYIGKDKIKITKHKSDVEPPSVEELTQQQSLTENNSAAKINSIMDLVSNRDEYEQHQKEKASNKKTVNKQSLYSSVTKTYKLPSKALLKDVMKDEKHIENIEIAKKTQQDLLNILSQYNIMVKSVKYTVGPAVTRFAIEVPTTTKISSITSIEANLRMALQARSIRIQAPIPGTNLIGIEIPNRYTTMVSFKDVVTSRPLSQKNPLSVGIGKDIDGRAGFIEINKTPHMLVAGATGSGKSVCINTIISSIILHAKPEQVRLLLIDPKMVEFVAFKGIPHLITPIITDPKEATYALEQVVDDMENRYKILSKSSSRNIEEYNAKVLPKDKLPYIVVIIDELADLMMVASKEVESFIARITQKARAAGIHLILATQRPSTDVVTGLIKSNIPTRVSFAVATSIDSRTILDSKGAETLLGKGDMLYKGAGISLTRFQGAYIDDDEIGSIVTAAKTQTKPLYSEQYLNLKERKQASAGATGSAANDPLFDDAKRFVIEQKRASTSLLQRQFNIGYNRAARIIDALEAQGVVSKSQGSKPRQVLVD